MRRERTTTAANVRDIRTKERGANGMEPSQSRPFGNLWDPDGLYDLIHLVISTCQRTLLATSWLSVRRSRRRSLTNETKGVLSSCCFLRSLFRLFIFCFSAETEEMDANGDASSGGVGRWWQKNHHLLSRQARPYHHSRSRSLRYNKRPPVKRSPHSHSPPSSLAPRVILAVHGLGNQFDSSRLKPTCPLCYV